jgi:radical SAM superfamily enzyme YgiQ (UPF0313 family)
MPLGVAYMKAVMDRDVPEVESRLFAYPEALLQAMQERPPQVLMCSNYLWNEALSLHFLDIAKRCSPDTLTVLGGPNIHLEPERQTAWLKARPQVDAYILGEGDFLAAEVVRHFLDAGMSVARFAERDVPSCVLRRPDGTVERTMPWKRHAEVDDVPSPFTTGIQDEFFDGRLAPMIETNRGCPFKCTFCVQGVDWYTKVHYFSVDRIKEDLNYIARMIQQRSPSMTMLRIADSNYGMYERDIEISSHIGKLQRDYSWPSFIDVTTGKNRPDRVIRTVEESSGAQVLYMAVQSLDENVLRKVKRQNIKLEGYQQLQMYMRGRGLRSNSDLILSLPGETIETHVTALNKLLDQRIDQMHNLQLLMLKGSELETESSRSTFEFDARWRIGPKNYGIYGGEKVFDVEEIVVATDTLSFEDYLHSRKLHLACSIFWNDSWFEDAFRFTDQFGIPRSEVFARFLPEMERSEGPAKDFLDSFVRETQNELFPTAEALREFYSQPENFAALLRGDIGENLMYKYRALASFHIWPEICGVAMRAIRGLLEERGVAAVVDDFDAFWSDFSEYIRLRHADGAGVEEVLTSQTGVLGYDIARWVADGYPTEVKKYRSAQPVVYQFSLSESGKSGLCAAFQVWTTRIQGLAKLVTRIQLQWQVRECVAVNGAPMEDVGRVLVTNA